jgi:hypothetical protein
VQFDLVRLVAARPVTVFAVVADIQNWPLIMRSVAGVEGLSAGRLHVGTHIRLRRVMFGHETYEELEIAEIERPRRLRLTTESPDLHYERDHIIDALDTGCRLTLVFRARAASLVGKGVLPFMSPLLEITMRDQFEQDLNDLVEAVHVRAPGRTARSA